MWKRSLSSLVVVLAFLLAFAQAAEAQTAHFTAAQQVIPTSALNQPNGVAVFASVPPDDYGLPLSTYPGANPWGSSSQTRLAV